MRVPLDENVPHDLISELAGHTVLTVQGLGWAGAENGDVLPRASGQADAFITMESSVYESLSVHRLPIPGENVTIVCRVRERYALEDMIQV